MWIEEWEIKKITFSKRKMIIFSQKKDDYFFSKKR
jgi:hypothetical protein